MITKNIRHTGIVISDIKDAKDFYCGLLEFKEINRGRLEQYESLKLLGLCDCEITWIKLGVGKDNLIELYYLENDNYRESYFETREEGGVLDLCHFAITVNDIDNVFEMLTDAGVDVICPPSIDNLCKHKLFFCRDYDGNLLEIVEEI